MTTENNELVCLTIFDDDTDRPLVRAMVEREVFAGYHKARNHDRYLAKKARARECSYDAKESQGISGAAYLDHLTARHAQEAPVEEGLYEALHEAMATLDERMQEALWALACGETTERAGGGVAVEQVDVPRSQGECAEAAARGACGAGIWQNGSLTKAQVADFSAACDFFAIFF